MRGRTIKYPLPLGEMITAQSGTRGVFCSVGREGAEYKLHFCNESVKLKPGLCLLTARNIDRVISLPRAQFTIVINVGLFANKTRNNET